MKTRWMTAPGALLLAAALVALMIPTHIAAAVPTNPHSIDPGFSMKMASFSCGLVIAPSPPTISMPMRNDEERSRNERQCAQQRDHRLDQTTAVAVAGVVVLGAGLILGRRRARSAVSPA